MEKNTIFLKPLIYCSVEQLLSILEIRNDESVRQHMLTSDLILEQHWFNYLLGLRQNKNIFHLGVFNRNGLVIGVIEVNEINFLNKTALWAIYLASDYRQGLGAVLEFYMMDYLFNEIGLEKIECTVLETNPAVLKMHLKFGYEIEGIKKNHVQRDLSRLNLYLLGLNKNRWLSTKVGLYSRYHKFIDKHSIHNLQLIQDASDEIVHDFNLKFLELTEKSLLDTKMDAKQIKNIIEMTRKSLDDEGKYKSIYQSILNSRSSTLGVVHEK